MKMHLKPWRKVLRNVAGDSGATFIEYAMLAGLVAIVVAIAAAIFGTKIKAIFSDTAAQADKVGQGVTKAPIVDAGAFSK